MLTALQYRLHRTKTYLFFGLDVSQFSGGKTFQSILGTILSVLIDVSREIFIGFVRTWALNCSKFNKETTYKNLRA